MQSLDKEQPIGSFDALNNVLRRLAICAPLSESAITLSTIPHRAHPTQDSPNIPLTFRICPDTSLRSLLASAKLPQRPMPRTHDSNCLVEVRTEISSVRRGRLLPAPVEVGG